MATPPDITTLDGTASRAHLYLVAVDALASLSSLSSSAHDLRNLTLDGWQSNSNMPLDTGHGCSSSCG